MHVENRAILISLEISPMNAQRVEPDLSFIILTMNNKIGNKMRQLCNGPTEFRE